MRDPSANGRLASASGIESALRKLEPQTTYFGRPLVFEPLLNYSNDYHYRPRSGSAYVQDRIEAGNEGSVITLGLRYDFLDPRAARPAVELVPQGAEAYREEVAGLVPAKVKHHFSPRWGCSFPLSDKSFFFVNCGLYVQYPLFDYLYSGLSNVNVRDGVNALRIVPEDALVIDRVILNQATGPGGIFISIVIDIRNVYEETFAGPIDVGGNIHIWWKDPPEIEANIALGEQVNLVLDPGQGYFINSAWLLQTDDGQDVFEMLDFTGNDVRDGIQYAEPEIFLLEVQVTLFNEIGLLRSGPHEFVLRGWQAVGDEE